MTNDETEQIWNPDLDESGTADDENISLFISNYPTLDDPRSYFYNGTIGTELFDNFIYEKKSETVAFYLPMTLFSCVTSNFFNTFSDSELHSNLYFMGLGESSGGKDRPLTTFEKLLPRLSYLESAELEDGIGNLIQYTKDVRKDYPTVKPRSEAGLRKALKDDNGTLLVLDSENTDSRKAQNRSAHENCNSLLKTCYSYKHKIHEGQANRNNNDPVRLPAPTVLNLTQTGRFFDSFSKDRVDDGDYARYLFFVLPRSVDMTIDLGKDMEQENKRLDGLRKILETVVEKLAYVKVNNEKYPSAGAINKKGGKMVCEKWIEKYDVSGISYPRQQVHIRCSEGAILRYNEYVQWLEEMKQAETESDYSLTANDEQVMTGKLAGEAPFKLALLFWIADMGLEEDDWGETFLWYPNKDGLIITDDQMERAIRLCKHHIKVQKYILNKGYNGSPEISVIKESILEYMKEHNMKKPTERDIYKKKYQLRKMKEQQPKKWETLFKQALDYGVKVEYDKNKAPRYYLI
jgi:hypothetical protein